MLGDGEPIQLATSYIPWSIAEGTKIAEEDSGPLVLVGAGTGCRPGELFGLTVPAVDFLRRSLAVERQLVRVKGRGAELTTLLKTDKSGRTVPLAQVIVDLLAEHVGVPAGGVGRRTWRNGHHIPRWA